MAFIEIGNDGVTNDTTPVTIVPAPGESVRRLVRHITIHNPMVAEDAVVILSLNNNESLRTIWKGTLYSGDTFDSDDDLYILDTEDKSLEIALVGASTTDLEWTVSYGDATT
jgi:hypothetical protein